MSKSNKNEGFEALRDAILIRKKATNVLRVLALQSQKKRFETFEGLLATVKTDEEIMRAKETIMEERFNSWLIKQECKAIAQACLNLTESLRTANTIWPTYMGEFTERRIYMDKALGACNILQDELQYIAESVYADKNKFTALVLEIETLFKKIKSVRQADNRFLKMIKDVVSKD